MADDALLAAARNGDVAAVEAALASGADLKATDHVRLSLAAVQWCSVCWLRLLDGGYAFPRVVAVCAGSGGGGRAAVRGRAVCVLACADGVRVCRLVIADRVHRSP